MESSFGVNEVEALLESRVVLALAGVRRGRPVDFRTTCAGVLGRVVYRWEEAFGVSRHKS